MTSAEAYFEDLLMRVIEGVATEEEFATFAGIIRHDDELRRRYAREMRLHALLSCQGDEKATEATVAAGANFRVRARAGADVSVRRQASWRSGLRRSLWRSAAALALLLGGAAVWHGADALLREASGAKPRGTLASAVPAVRFVSQNNVKGLDLPQTLPGVLRLQSGEVVVRLQTGVEVAVIGPATLVVRNGLHITLESGRLLANVPHWATGFTVRTTDLEVYDLGTVFGVSASERMSDVFVFKGSVQVNEAGPGEEDREASGAGVGICEAGEGVRAVRGAIPVRFVSDWPEARKVFGRVRGDEAWKDPAAALQTADQLADLWAERYMPGSALAPKKVRKGNGMPFQTAAWVRASAPPQGIGSLDAAGAPALSAAAVPTGTAAAGAASLPIRVDTSPRHNRHWSTVFTNAVALSWEWVADATRAELEIEGMNGAFATNFTPVTSSYLWRPFTSTIPATEDVYDLKMTFFNDGFAVVGVLTSRLAVVTAAFGRTVVISGSATRSWTTVRDNVVIAYDASWTAATDDALRSQWVTSKAGDVTQTHVFSDASGYLGLKLKKSDWGYGTFSLALTFLEAEGEWKAAVTRPLDGTVFSLR